MIPILNHPDGEKFIYNYFINTECYRFPKTTNLNFCFLSPYNRNSKSYINYLLTETKHSNSKDILSEIIGRIDNGCYSTIFFDDFYLIGKPNYGENHWIHINFIYGYDTEEKKLLSIGYDRNVIYRKMDIPFDVVNLAFDGEASFLKEDLAISFELDVISFISQIEDYLSSQNNLVPTSELDYFGFHKSDFTYGVSVYEYILKHIYDAVHKNTDYDARNIYVLYEHKELMKKRLLYLLPHGEFKITVQDCEESQEIAHKCKIAKCLLQKWKINCKPNDADRALQIINEVKRMEITLLEKICARHR